MRIKTRTLIVLIVIQTLFFMRCEVEKVNKNLKNISQPDLTEAEMKRLVLLDTSYVYPVEQAKTNALNLAAQFLNQDGVNRSISKVVTVPSLYSAERKTLIKTNFTISKPKTPSIYIVNFKDEKGYVMLAADKRANEILAMVGSGTIDSLMHPGLRVFLSNAVFHVDEKVAELESFRGDTDYLSMVSKLEESFATEKNTPRSDKSALYVPGRTSAMSTNCVYVSSTVPITTPVNTTTYIAQPLLKTLWHQGPPYNNEQAEAGCNTSGYLCGKNSKYPAGCVAIAEGQVAAFFSAKKYSTWQAIVGKSCETYTVDESNTVANLAHSIFLDYTPWNDRTCSDVSAGLDFSDVSLTDPRGISPKYGLVEGEWRGWNTGDIRSSLANGSPVVISGMRNLFCIIYCIGSGGGHEWVIDGMRDLGVKTTYLFTAYYQGIDCMPSQQSYYQSYTYTSNPTTATQIHQNWGWGRYKGSEPTDWYAQDVFQSTYRVPGWDNNFNHANYIVAYITPL